MSNKELKPIVFDNGKETYETNIEDVKKLAASGSMDGHYALGMAYLYGWDIEPDMEKGFNELEKASEMGHADAMALLVKMFFSGDYTGITTESAVEYAKIGSEEGVADAQLYLGVAYQDGICVNQDYSKAADLFRKSMNQGNIDARNSLAYLYQEGLGVEKDEEKAYKLYRIAAQKGNPYSQFQIGVCLEFGIGAKKDWNKAAEWYSKAAEQGDPASMLRLGLMYYFGEEDFPIDPEMSFKCLLESALHGMVDAQYYVGCYYKDGFGVEKDEEEALKWVKIASEQGYECAVEKLNEWESAKE